MASASRDGAGVGAEGHALGHPGVGVAADDDRPVVDGDVVQDLVDDVRHRRVAFSGSRPVISPKSFMKLMSFGDVACAFLSQTDAVWQPDW